MQELNFDDASKIFEQAANQPALLLQLQSQWWEQQLQIWQNAALMGNTESVIAEDRGDKRFIDDAWKNDPFYSFIKQSYLLGLVKAISIPSTRLKALTRKPKSVWAFFHVSNHRNVPGNFIATNPELMKLTLREMARTFLMG